MAIYATPLPDSTCLEYLSYDKDGAKLYLEFHKSRFTYVYFGVPASVVAGLLESESAGKFFNSFIRNSYPPERSSTDANLI